MICHSKQQAAIDLCADDELQQLAIRICHSHADDLIQEAAMVLLQMDDSKWQKVNDGGYVRFYIVRTMMTMATSPRSHICKNTQPVQPQQANAQMLLMILMAMISTQKMT
jgi:hypothetical protein